ncbi:MAG: sigma-70 family RNA polymerase sigma factor [Actinomycetota bacterium]
MTDGRAIAMLLEETERRLRRALPAAVGVEATPDAIAEALAWAWEHRDRVETLGNPHGYLYRVAVNAGRRVPRTPDLPPVDTASIPEVEPGLVPALAELSAMQRQCVWLVHACDWTYAETAEALEISASAVGTHLTRGMTRLRTAIIGDEDHG